MVSNLKYDAGNEVRGQLREDFVCGAEVESFARPVVQEMFEVGELLMADLAEIQALGPELANQAIGVLIGAAPPPAVRVAEVDADLQLGAQGFTQRHLRASVVGHGLAWALGTAFELTLEALKHVVLGVAVKLDQHGVAADAPDQRANQGAIHCILDEITLPETPHDARGHLGRAQIEVGPVGQAALASSPWARGSRILWLLRSRPAHQSRYPASCAVWRRWLGRFSRATPASAGPAALVLPGSPLRSWLAVCPRSAGATSCSGDRQDSAPPQRFQVRTELAARSATCLALLAPPPPRDADFPLAGQRSR